MIDFHMHILHDIDDGPATLKDSIEMAKIAVADGTKTVVATPHAPGPNNIYHAQLVLSRVRELQEELEAQEIPLEILPGGELYYDADVVIRLKEGTFLTCGYSQTVLVECPIYDDLPLEFEQLVFDLQVAGYRVVLAHPERISTVRKDLNILIPFIQHGVLMQLTTQAILGDQGEHTQRIAETMLTHNMVHLLASDAHGTTYRPPLLAKARKRAAELIGEQAATALVQDIPRALLDDLPYEPPEPEEVRSRWG